MMSGTDAAGDQTITTYTVGFGGDVQSIAWAIDNLKSTATRGGGSFFTAGDTASLTDAFTNIISEIFSVNTTFTAPTVAVNAFNRTQNLDDLFITVFGTPQPPSGGNKFHWPGNIKKYEITPEGVIVGPGKDAADPRVPVVDATQGFFSATAKSFWSDVVDGSDVALGGAAHEIPAPADRKIYTDIGGNTLKDHPINKGNTDITDAILGIDGASTITRDELVEWVRGADVDATADPTKARFQMGDPLHGRPATVIYGGTEDNPDLTLFAVTNDGYLHAIDTKDGSELWAYVPGPMLRRMDDLYENESQPNEALRPRRQHPRVQAGPQRQRHRRWRRQGLHLLRHGPRRRELLRARRDRSRQSETAVAQGQLQRDARRTARRSRQPISCPAWRRPGRRRSSRR